MKRHGPKVAALTAVLVGGFLAPTEAAAPERTGDIIYVRGNPAFTDEVIGSMNADGSGQRKISKGFDVAPAYSPDGQRIAFTSLRDTPPGHKGGRLDYSELYVMDADGANVERVTVNERLVDWQPTWSPDGNEILIARGPSTPPPPGQLTGPTDLWIIDLTTGRERQLTDSPDTWEGYADWSPDGSRIVFEGDLLNPGNIDLYSIGVDGSGLQRLTTAPDWDGDPDYAPDGSHIAFTIYPADPDVLAADIYTIDVEGGGQQQLTTSGSDHSPVYSPDSQFIAFASARDGHKGSSDIFRMRADGTQQTNLTRTRTVFEFDPDWKPS